MSERDSYELRRIRRENEKQTNFMTAKSLGVGGAALICLGLVVQGVGGIILGILGVLLMLLPVITTASIVKECMNDGPKCDRIEVIRPKSFDEEPENTEEE